MPGEPCRAGKRKIILTWFHENRIKSAKGRDDGEQLTLPL